MRDSPGCERFRRAFLALAEEARPDGHAIWCLFCEDSWSRTEMEFAARRTLRRRHKPRCWRREVVSDMIDLLERDLRHSPSLHYDRTRPPEGFGGFCGGVFDLLARQAVRFERRMHPRHRAPVESDRVCDDRAAHDRAIDVDALIEAQPERVRTVLALLLDGRTKAEIERRTGLSHKQLWRLIGDLGDEFRAALGWSDDDGHQKR
ncbi:MAG TPA: hypothetical protein VND64_15245 [Pirellulales bacterium]|nr:hypothetical protein [Pirellulales bacterium]